MKHFTSWIEKPSRCMVIGEKDEQIVETLLFSSRAFWERGWVGSPN